MRIGVRVCNCNPRAQLERQAGRGRQDAGMCVPLLKFISTPGLVLVGHCSYVLGS